MKSLGFVIALFAALFTISLSAPASAAALIAKIDLSSQRMYVSVNGQQRYTWAVSTARVGYRTPVGSFYPKALKRVHFSSKYDNAPMPHSIFFLGGYAIHGTNAIRTLGRAVSHGCVRLAPGNAAALFAMVQRYGMGNTRIVVTR